MTVGRLVHQAIEGVAHGRLEECGGWDPTPLARPVTAAELAEGLPRHEVEDRELLPVLERAAARLDLSRLTGVEVQWSEWIAGVEVRGRVDAVEHLADGSARVVDYKTGGQPVRERELRDDPQALLYLYWARQLYGGEPRFRLVGVLDGWSAEIAWDPIVHDRAERLVAESAADVARHERDTPPGEPWPARVTPTCASCMVRRHCTAYRAAVGSDPPSGLEALPELAEVVRRRKLLEGRERELRAELEPHVTDDGLRVDLPDGPTAVLAWRRRSTTEYGSPAALLGELAGAIGCEMGELVDAVVRVDERKLREQLETIGEGQAVAVHRAMERHARTVTTRYLEVRWR